ncbi:MAG: hypothetical protein CMJ18_01335 [Phycisphaeraceae bacterium]|nr:hypothetical protein [Phycisphaeraceae bacterium]
MARENGRSRRRHERIKPGKFLSCPLGELMDVSVSGLRLSCTGKPPVEPKQRLSLTINSQYQKISLEGQVVRVVRKGFRRYEISMRFVDMTPQKEQVVENLARHGYYERQARGPRPAQPAGAAGDAGASAGQARSAGASESSASVDTTIEDPYWTLGVPRDATDEAIKQAYRDMARKYHPDVCKDANSNPMFNRIGEAYALLKDPDKRRTYDQTVRG